MPLPLIIGGIAAAAAAGGVGASVHGGMQMKNADATLKRAQDKQEKAIALFKGKNDSTTGLMDQVGRMELKILKSFEDFSNVMEKIQGRPEFKKYSIEGVQLPKYKPEDLKKVSTGASVLMGGLGGAAVGTAGGFAAAGATTSAVMVLGTASTGTAIASLSGAAATNATLAALGGGAIAAGGGGMALGTAVLGGATLGFGLLVGGIIFNVTGNKLSNKADEAYRQAEKTEKEVNKIIDYLNDLFISADEFQESLFGVKIEYEKRLRKLNVLVNTQEKSVAGFYRTGKRNDGKSGFTCWTFI